jgi:hypothetical protein
MLLVEQADPAASGPLPNLGSRALDRMVAANRRVAAANRAALRGRVERVLSLLADVFRTGDPLLARQSFATLDYLFVRALAREGAVEPDEVRAFLELFQQRRVEALRDADGASDQVLEEFTHLMQHGTNEPRSLERRLAILLDLYRQRRAAPAG